MDNFYVYHLINSHNNLPFYIGKGIKNRLYHHEKMVRNNKIPNNTAEFQIVCIFYTVYNKVK